MKYVVVVTLLGVDGCQQTVLTYSEENVSSSQECLSLAAEYLELPFVKAAECNVTWEKEK